MSRAPLAQLDVSWQAAIKPVDERRTPVCRMCLLKGKASTSALSDDKRKWWKQPDGR